MCKANYRFSPSVLDKFQHLVEAPSFFESDFNYAGPEEGYKQTLEEIEANRTQELLDAINKTPHEPIEAAARGTAFNELVDYFVECARYGETRVSTARENSLIDRILIDVCLVDCEGFTFRFDRILAEEVAKIVAEGTMQLHIQAELETSKGKVLLHGFPDYILPTYVTDLKTTGHYTFGNYEGYMQRFTYPYILLHSGLMQRIEKFTFLVVEMKEDKTTGVIGGTIYKEDYTDVNIAHCEAELREVCEGLIDFVEEYRHLITNPKIFNECEDQ